VNPEMLATAQAGRTQLSVEQHERVAVHYDVSSVNLPAELADRIQAGTMTWETFGGTHPGPAGNQLAADLVADVLKAGWTKAKDSPAPVDHPTMKAPLLSSSFDQGGFFLAADVMAGEGWMLSVPDWSAIAGSKRDRFLKESIFHSNQPGAMLSFQFSGHAVGAYVLAGPDAGQLEVQIDDGEWTNVELFHAYSSGLHYPRTVMFASGLKRGDHTVRVRLANTHHASSKGTAARILEFVVAR
jgi:hypothetical protein